MKTFISWLLFILICSYPAKSQDVESILSVLKTDRQKADTLFSSARKYFRKARFDSADYLLNIGIHYAENTNDDELIAKYYITHGNVVYFTEDINRGLHLLKKAYPYLTKISTYNLHNNYLMLNGLYFQKLHRNDSAIYYYHQCELLNNREDPYRNWLLYATTALLFQQADDFTKAEEYFNKAYELTKAKGNRMDMGVVINQFADLYYQWGNAEKFAFMLHEQQKAIPDDKKDIRKDPVHSMFYIEWEKKSFEDKVAFMENVNHELLKKGDKINVAVANNYIISFYEKENQPAQALKYVKENQHIFESEKDIIGLYMNTKISYRLMKKAGKIQEAIAEADTLFAMRDSIISLQQRQIMLDLEAKYETEKKEKDIVLLNSENQLSALRLAKEKDLKGALIRENLLKDSVVASEKNYNNLLGNENELRKSQLANEVELKAAVSRENILKGNQLTKEKRIRWQLTIGTLLLLLFGLIILFMYRKQRAKNLLIQKQSDDLQMLMKEIHHRVKNNLQVISSLLDLQSLTIKDTQASEAIKESRNRVYSMALIHQSLYKDENIIGIEMNDYINKLVQSLFQSYSAGENKISLETDIDPILLDVDMVIPIGLVLNELISNSLKYAFNDTSPGILHIALKKYDSEMLLKVKDNGKGFPGDLNVSQSQSFGYKLVKAFAKKLKARLEVFNDNGACVILHISKIKFG